MEHRWGMEACWCGRVRAQAERSTPEVSNEPQAGGLMAEWNARPTMCVYCIHTAHVNIRCREYPYTLITIRTPRVVRVQTHGRHSDNYSLGCPCNIHSWTVQP